MKRLVFIAGHPVPYHVPLYREVGHLPEIDSVVFFQDPSNLNPKYTEEFKTAIKWDIPLLDGYRYRFFRNLGFSSSGGFLSRINFGLAFALIKERFDIVVVHGYSTVSDWLAVIAAKLSGAKLIMKGEATLRPTDKANGSKARLKRFVLNRLFSICDAIMYSCSGNKEFFAYYAENRKELFFLPCAVDNKYFQAQRAIHLPHREELRRKLGLHPQDFAIVMTARLVARKRPLDLLKALSKLSRQDLIAVFVGDGPERPILESYCRDNGVRAIFSGFKNQSELAPVYCAVDCFALLSDYDPSPKTLNEAMNFALPLLCTSCSGTATDLVLQARTGFIVEAGDIDKIAEKINYLAENRDSALSMGNAALELVDIWSPANGARAFNQLAATLFHKDQSLSQSEPNPGKV